MLLDHALCVVYIPFELLNSNKSAYEHYIADFRKLDDYYDSVTSGIFNVDLAVLPCTSCAKSASEYITPGWNDFVKEK